MWGFRCMLLANSWTELKKGGRPVRNGCCFSVAGAFSNVGASALSGNLRLEFRGRGLVNCCLGKVLKFFAKPLERMFGERDFSCCCRDGGCRNDGVGESCGKAGWVGARAPCIGVVFAGEVSVGVGIGGVSVALDVDKARRVEQCSQVIRELQISVT